MLAHRLLALFAVAAAAIPAAAAGQCRLCDQPTTARADNGTSGADVQLQIETNLNFDRLILGSSGTGAVTIRPNGSTGAEGSVSQVGPRAMVGTVLVHGDAGRALTIELPRRIELYSLGGGRLTLEDVTSDAAAIPRLDSAGNLSFRFGGRLILSGNADGQYHGDLPIIVNYAEDTSGSAEILSGH